MKKLFFTLFAATLLCGVGLAVSTGTVLAVDEATKQAACDGLASAGSGCDAPGAESAVESLIRNVVTILSWVVGVASIIMVIIGAFKYVISGGDSNGITSAKNTIMYALIGLVIASMAQVLVRFVLNRSGDAVPSSSSSNSVNACRPDGSNPDPSRPCAR